MDQTLILCAIVIFAYFSLAPEKTQETVCIDNVTYITTLSGITAKFDTESKIVQCNLEK